MWLVGSIDSDQATLVAVAASLTAGIQELIRGGMRYMNRRAETIDRQTEITAGDHSIYATTINNLFLEVRDLRNELIKTNEKVDHLQQESQRRARVIAGLKTVVQSLRREKGLSEMDITRMEREEEAKFVDPNLNG